MWNSGSQEVVIEHLQVKRIEDNPRTVKMLAFLNFVKIEGMTSTDKEIHKMISSRVDVHVEVEAVYSTERLLRYDFSFRPNCPNRDGIIHDDLKFFFPELISIFDSSQNEGKHFATKLTSPTISLLKIPNECYQVISDKLHDLKTDFGEPLPAKMRCKKERGEHLRNWEGDFTMLVLSYLVHTRNKRKVV